MALSNIFREPRRELIEQAYGTAAVVAVLGAWFTLAAVLCRLYDGAFFPNASEFLFALFQVAAVVAFLCLVLSIVHDIGESICNSMAKRGRDPRPRQRR